MEDTGIISFSLDTLGQIETFSWEEDYNYSGAVFVHRDSKFGKQLEVFKYPCRINAYIAILCTNGKAEIISNLRKFTIKKNCLYVSMPNDIVQVESWNDCEFYCFAFNDSFFGKMKIDMKSILSMFLKVQKYPCIEISQKESASLEQLYFCLMNDIQLLKDTEYYNEVILNYISLFIYKGSSVIVRKIKSADIKLSEVTYRNEEYFEKFTSLLNRYFKSEHNIEFYASRMCITPKYLSSLIRKISGRSANQWINDYIIMEAKHLLKYSKMSIQEISYYLCFPNQSFFAQYFKRQTGMTPTCYRIQP